jgi:hypothetical protein
MKFQLILAILAEEAGDSNPFAFAYEVGLAEGETILQNKVESLDCVLTCTDWATLDPKQANILVAMEFRAKDVIA